MNSRAFVEPPVMEIRPDGIFVLLHMYHWCAHPRFGASRHEFRFESEELALKYMDRLGFTIIKE